MEEELRKSGVKHALADTYEYAPILVVAPNRRASFLVYRCRRTQDSGHLAEATDFHISACSDMH